MLGGTLVGGTLVGGMRVDKLAVASIGRRARFTMNSPRVTAALLGGPLAEATLMSIKPAVLIGSWSTTVVYAPKFSYASTWDWMLRYRYGSE